MVPEVEEATAVAVAEPESRQVAVEDVLPDGQEQAEAARAKEAEQVERNQQEAERELQKQAEQAQKATEALVVVEAHENQTKEVPNEKPQQVTEYVLKLPNKLLGVSIFRIQRGEDPTQAALVLEVKSKHKFYFIDEEKPVVLDAATGRRMIRVHDSLTGREGMYDPLSGEVFPPAVARQTEDVDLKLSEENYDEELAETIAETVEDEAQVSVEAPTANGHATAADKDFVVYQIFYETNDAAKTHQITIVAKRSDPNRPAYIITSNKSVITYTPERVQQLQHGQTRTEVTEKATNSLGEDWKKHVAEDRWSLIEGIRTEAITNPGMTEDQRKALAEKVLGRPPTPEEWSAIWEAHKVADEEAGFGTYKVSHLLRKAKILEEAGFSKKQWQELMAAGIAGSAEQHRDNIQNTYTHPDIERERQSAYEILSNAADAAIDERLEQQQLLPIINRLRPIARNATHAGQAEAQELLDQLLARMRTITGREGRGRVLREMKREFKREQYYAGQAGTIPTPDFVGFSFMSRYIADKDISEAELVEHFRNEFNEIMREGTDQQRLEKQQFYVAMHKLFDTRKYRLYFNEAEINDDKNSPDYGLLQSYYIRKVDELGNIVDRELTPGEQQEIRDLLGRDVPLTFQRVPGRNEELLKIAQYAELKHRQMDWLTRELEKVALTAVSDQDVGRQIGHIRRSENDFLDFEVNERLEALLVLYTARARFKNGLQGLDQDAHAMRQWMHYYMQLPGVAELMGEFEKREFENLMVREEDGTIRRRNANDPDIKRIFRERDRNAQNQIRDELARRHATNDHSLDWMAKYLDDEQYTNDLDDETKNLGGMNLTWTGRRDDPEGRERYDKVAPGFMRAVIFDFLEERRREVERLTGERNRLRAEEKHFDAGEKDLEISRVQNQQIDQTSVEVAEWIWRISGRAALFFDVTNEGQYQQYQINNQGRFALQKQRAWDDKDMLRIAFGTEDYDQGRVAIQAKEAFLPGIASGYNLNAGWYDYFSNYTIVYPNNLKPALYRAGIEKYVRPEVAQTVERFYRRLTEGDLQNLSEREVMGRLTQEERDHIQEYHQAVALYIGTDSWRKIKKNKEVWGDWHDMGADLATATKGKDVVFKFLEDIDIKNVEGAAANENRWYRIWRVGKPIDDRMNALIDYRSTYNKKNKHIPNLDADDIDRLITQAYERATISKTSKEKLEAKQLGSKLRGPVLPGMQKRLFDFEIQLPKLLRKPWIFVAKYKVFGLSVIFGGISGFLKSLQKVFMKGITPPTKA